MNYNLENRREYFYYIMNSPSVLNNRNLSDNLRQVFYKCASNDWAFDPEELYKKTSKCVQDDSIMSIEQFIRDKKLKSIGI